jgi:hypothetical protein
MVIRLGSATDGQRVASSPWMLEDLLLLQNFTNGRRVNKIALLIEKKRGNLSTFLKLNRRTIKLKQERELVHKHNTESRFSNNCWRGKAESATYSECVF